MEGADSSLMYRDCAAPDQFPGVKETFLSEMDQHLNAYDLVAYKLNRITMNFITPPNRKFIRAGRIHDYIYDPVYTTSSRRDFFKDAGRSANAGAKMTLRPVYPTMFSELMRDKRLEACLVMQRPNLLENFMPQYQIRGIPVSPMNTSPAYVKDVEVTGADRAKFIIKYLPETYRMARPVVEYDLEDEKRKNRKKRRPRGQFVNRGIQTDYRESETQTDPYTPTHSLPYPDAFPKVLALMKLTWGKGLPATLEDIVVIERALTRRILEVGLRDVENDSDFEKRVNLMEELEAQQWADREKELSLVMAQKMDIVSKMLIDLRSKIVNEHTMKMERTYELRKKNNMKYLAQLKHSYMRDERKLDCKYSCPPKQFKRDIVKEYLEFDSQVYAPLVRNGPNLDMLHKAPCPSFQHRLTYADLENITHDKKFIMNELEFDVGGFVKKAMQIKLPGKDQRMEKKLDEVYNAFRTESTRKQGFDDTALLKQMMNTIRRMETPTIEGQPPEEDQRDQAIMNIQKIIRGRAVQIMMRSEIHSNMETMLEMKALHKSDPFGLKATFGEVMAMRNLQNQREQQQDKQNEVTEITDQLEGETLGRMFDFLDKEMVRLLDERKIHTLMILAERERRMREATEAGNRDREENIRRTNDEVFRQIVGIHQSTVDLYLEDMYLETMNRTADDIARIHVQNLARVLNEAACLTDHNVGEDKEELSADLVHSFLIPEMNRMYQRQRMESLHARYSNASKQVTDATFSAQGVIREIIDSLVPTITEHMKRGEVAVTGTQDVVECIIKEAVKSMVQQIEPDKSSEGSSESPSLLVSVKSSEASVSVPKPSLMGDKVDEIESVPKELTDSSESTNLDNDSGEEEIEPPWTPIPIQKDLPVLLGEKSLELEYDAEVGVDAVFLFDSVSGAVNEIFKDTTHSVLPADSEEDFTDEELDDDNEII